MIMMMIDENNDVMRVRRENAAIDATPNAISLARE
jgi:hypothetical protein